MLGRFRRNSLPEGVDASRVPPGQTLASGDRWPLLHFGPVPRLDLEHWDLRVFGAVAEPLRLDHAEFLALPRRQVTADIHCVTGWSRLGDTWEGVPVGTVLERARPAPEARFAMLHCEHGYSTSIPLELLDADDVLLCDTWNGKPLSVEHGYPLRMLLPSRYFWKSAKWLRGIELMTANRLGFWEQRGYHDEADPWKEQRYW